MDSQDDASPFHQRIAFKVFRAVTLQEDSSSVSVMPPPPQVSLNFSHSFPKAEHGNRHCPYILHSSFSQQEPSCCLLSLPSLTAFISSSTHCIKNGFLLLLWHSDMFSSPRDSFTLFHRTFLVLLMYIFLVSGYSTTWLALLYPHTVRFPMDRFCLQAVFMKSPLTSSFSSLGISSHTQYPGFSNCLHCSALVLQVLFLQVSVYS